MPDVPPGPYADHMALDVARQRLFTTPQAEKAVVVVDLNAGRVVHTIHGFGNPHAVLYREDRNRLFVTDGGGALVILDSRSYRRLHSIPLAQDADGIAYDDATGTLYVSNGGAEAGNSYSLISIIDTAREQKVGDIRIEATALEAMIVSAPEQRLYVNMPERNAIGVIDLGTHALVATWPLAFAKRNEAFSINPEQHELYVGCNEGDVRGGLVILDTRTGKELQRLPIGSWVDSMYYDDRRRRIYASAGVGAIFTYERGADGQWRSLEPVDTAVMARTALFSTDLDRLYVMVPHLGWTTAKVLVFEPR